MVYLFWFDNCWKFWMTGRIIIIIEQAIQRIWRFRLWFLITLVKTKHVNFNRSWNIYSWWTSFSHFFLREWKILIPYTRMDNDLISPGTKSCTQYSLISIYVTLLIEQINWDWNWSLSKKKGTMSRSLRIMYSWLIMYFGRCCYHKVSCAFETSTIIQWGRV